MDANRWKRAKELFGSALEREPSERSAFLAEACGGDESLRQEVESLLAAHQDVASTAVTATEQSSSVADIDEDRILGRRIGTYQVMKRIGEGGMAAVYLAFRADDQYRKQVAIKLVPLAMATRELVQRFRNERQTLAALEHPNIVRLLDGGTTEDDRPYLVMEYVEGTPITEYADTHRLSVTERLQLFRTVCSAVSYAHQRMVIHRDLKPSNILVTAEGTPKLLDFGIAKLLNPELLAEKLAVTQAGQRLMTPEYASPEQVRGEPLTNASDIYSLGAILYELLTGHQLYRFKTYTITEIEHLICEEDPNKPSTVVTQAEEVVWPGGVKHKTITPEEVSRRREDKPERLRRKLQGDLDTIVMMALRKEPQRRYASVYDLSEDIRRHLEGLPVKARPSTIRYHSTKFLRRHREATISVSVFVLVLIVAILFAFDVGGLRKRISGNSLTIDSIAVLPFTNTNKDPDTEYLSDGITESLIDELSQVSNFRVMSPATIFTYKGRQVDPRKVGQELHVSAVLQGSVTRFGETLRIVIDLVNAADGTELWGEQYNRKAADVLAVQHEIGREIVARLGKEQRLSAKRSTENPQAYQLYLKGLYNSKKFTKEGLLKGEDYFNQAIAIDPNYTLALNGLAYNYAIAEDWIFPPREVMPKEKVAAQKAVQIDDSFGDAHANVGYAYFFYDFNFPVAEQEFKRSIALSPNDSYAHEMYSWFLAALKRPDEAIAEGQRTQRVDPLSAEGNMIFGQTLYYVHHYDQAIEQLRNTIDMDPRLWVSYDLLGWCYEVEGRLPEAIGAYQKAHQIVGGAIAEPLASLGRAYALQGKKREAEKAIADLRELSNHNHVTSYYYAMIYAGLGDKDQAIAELDKAYDQRSWYVVLLAVDPKVDNLRSDPRFKELVQRVGLPQ